MNRHYAKLYLQALLQSTAGQMLLSFARVVAATFVGCWLQAGASLEVSVDDLRTWAEVGLQAGVALVVANYLGPWEKRYGRRKQASEDAHGTAS